MQDLWALVAAERMRIADTLETLESEQWSTPSLCGAWTVRDVAGHLTAGFAATALGAVVGIVKHRGFDSYNAANARMLGARPTAEIIDDLRRNVDHRFRPPGSGPEAPLSDVVIHSGDIRRPLDLASTTAPEALAATLDRLAHPSWKLPMPLKKVDDLEFRATDQDWGSGRGALVEGTAEALVMAMAGRRSALGDLSGDGVVELAKRLRS